MVYAFLFLFFASNTVLFLVGNVWCIHKKDKYVDLKIAYYLISPIHRCVLLVLLDEVLFVAKTLHITWNTPAHM